MNYNIIMNNQNLLKSYICYIHCLPNGFGMSSILTVTMLPPAGTITAESLLRSSTIRFSVPSGSLSYIKLMATHCISPGLLPGGKVSIAGEGPSKSCPSERSEINLLITDFIIVSYRQ